MAFEAAYGISMTVQVDTFDNIFDYYFFV